MSAERKTMQKLTFDTGVRSYKVGGGVLKFNPTDPNIYARFLETLDSLSALEEELAKVSGADAITALACADKTIKEKLSYVFGVGNDLEAIFSGVSLLAVGANGERLITNFLAAIEPILSAGARQCAAAEAAKL